MTIHNRADNTGIPDRSAKQQGEPIAIVGMACRFPGANNLDAFWNLLEEGGNSVTEGVPGSGEGRLAEIITDPSVQSEACRFGAFVDDIDKFDAAFFRISPVEAELLDPQQRMMLETSWEALEDAGIDPLKLKHSLTGMYTGISNDEYRMLVLDTTRPTEAAGSLYALSGTNLNGTAGRVSFVLGLMGPAKAVDAACASALVAVTDAVNDLQQGKADLAIAAGVQAIINGRIYELRAEAMMLSPEGQCKTFDASADGYVRGEGCGVVVLKRLSDAERDGDRIWAVIKGAAVNHGGDSVGLTVPNPPALKQVMETALSDAGVLPQDVDFLEAHGTGTAVGDPIELEAVSEVYCEGRDASNPILIGSVKTNIGHLESAAGIAGLIKAALALKHRVIPKQLHFNDPNPRVDWDKLPIKVTTEHVEWKRRGEHPRVAGVNCFGISGTNSHIVVEEYSGAEADAEQENPMAGSVQEIPVTMPASGTDLATSQDDLAPRKTRFLPLSTKSDGALRDLAGRYLSWLDERADELSSDGIASGRLLSDMSWTAGFGRSQFERRVGVVFRDIATLRAQLGELSESDASIEPRTASKVAFIYTGQGSQWVGMGQALYESEPVARAVMDRCEEVFREVRGVSLLDVMFGRNGVDANLGDTAWEQPALYTLECALTALWSSVGIHPNVVLGHSVGEIAAAQAAGVFSLEEGMRFAAARGTLMSQMESGTMAAVFAPPEQVAAEVETHNASTDSVGLSIAADNGAHQAVSGPVEDIEAIVARFESLEVRARRLNTTKAFHSALVDPILGGLEDALEGLEIKSPTLTVVSNLTGQAVEPGMSLDVDYWKRHAREAVAFASGVRAMAEQDVDVVVEIGPHDILGTMATLAWPDSAPPALASLRRPPRDGSSPEPESSFIDAVAAAYEAGLDVRFEGLYAGEKRRRISLPSYPFQRERYWVEQTRQRRQSAGHALLGERHESARGEIIYETEVFPSDPAWLNDHRVFGRLVAPGALYGAMATSAALAEGSGPIVVEDFQLHNPLVFAESDATDGSAEEGGTVQVFLDDSGQVGSKNVQIFSKGIENEWILHIEGRVSAGAQLPEAGGRVDLDALKARLSPADVPDYYRAKADTGINLGPFFRTLGNVWSAPGEALGEVNLPEAAGRNDLDVHPLLMDGCFQVIGVARNMTGEPGEATYLPFGWERFWLTRQLPDRLVCHVIMSEGSTTAESESEQQPEVMSGEMRIYDLNGILIGGFSGYTVKRATRAALLSAFEGVDDLLYEIDWRDRPLESGLMSAYFFPTPATVAEASELFPEYLTGAGVDPQGRNELLADLEQWSRAYALRTLEKLGWERRSGEVVDADELRERLNVNIEHSRLFLRMLEMLAQSGVLEQRDDGFVVLIGEGEPLPPELPENPEEFDKRMVEKYPHGLTETGLFKRSGAALADVLRGQEDPLTLLFSSGEPTAADLYLKAPVARAANGMLADAMRELIARLPKDRRLRIVEIGAGTGSATASVLPELPEGRFDYVYTDISAGFFAEAEARFGDGDGCIEYRVLDIEKDPIAQGYDAHSYDIVLASNVLHATRYLQETLAHCRDLLSPSGQLIALENLRGLGWMDLTFGQLDGWWRFADDYRPHHALATPAIWRQALGDVGFEEVEVLGVDDTFTHEMLDKGVIVAQGPAQVTEQPGLWVLAASDQGGLAEEFAAEMAERNQTVVLAVGGESQDSVSDATTSGVIKTAVDVQSRESWRSLIEGLPDAVSFKGVIHLEALHGHGPQATTEEIAEDVKRVGASALAMVQGLSDSDVIPENGVWFITRGAQVLERELSGELAGATLWGLGKVVTLEASHLQPRMIDLDPATYRSPSELVNDLMYPDDENHIAYRLGRRLVARLVRPGTATERLTLPDDSDWVLAPHRDSVFDKPEIKRLPTRTLEPREVLVSVEATGLNFWDVFRSLGFIEEGDLGRELCGHVLDIGSEVTNTSVGDRVVGLGFGAFGPEMVTHEELVAPAPDGISVSGLATIPSAFVSAELSFRLSGLEPGDRVLIHAGSGGVGLAAIQLAQAAGAEVFATASAPKQAYLRSVGVKHIYDSRQTKFGEEILADTEGEGIHVVLNSLTSEGFIDASLSCLAQGGRFVELARRDILSHEKMAERRPDVKYDILELDVLKKTDPELVGEVLRDVMARISTEELKPIVHSRWPLAEAGTALSFMRSARHIGKIVLTPPPLSNGQLRRDRSYLVTGGLGGIGIAVAEWLADHGAGTIVLNGRRDPDPEAQVAIEALRGRGIEVEVELADMTNTTAIDAMLERMDANYAPLGGVIHSVGVLSDAALTNQSWESFEHVLSPKIVGAWHLHRATIDRDLDMFILFSSRVGVMGNPGQANHAAANAFLDQLAGHRRALGLPGQAIAWGAWSEIGEAAEQRDRIEQRRAALGGRWFTPQQGIRALEKLVREDTTASVVMSMDWSVFEEAVEDRPALLEDMLSSLDEAAAEDGASTEDVLTRLRNTVTPADEQQELLVSFLQQELQAVLRLSSAPSPTVGFFDLGMDSLMAVEFRNRLNRAFAGEYTASNTVVFDYADIASLAGHLAEELGQLGDASPAPEPAVPVASQLVSSDTDGIAIVGMACRFPQSKNLSEYWQLLESGTDAVTDGRPGNGIAPDMRGAFIEGIEWFDSRFFRISPVEARLMDPQQRMMLETSWEALEDAGIDPDGLRGSQTGVYAGIGGSEYREVIESSGKLGNYLGTNASVAAGRIAFSLGLEGPAMAIDMACASALAAVHQAVSGLQREEVDLALAGGVHVVLSPSVSDFMTELGMLSKSGKSSPFDASADGYVRGEGCGVLVLKRLSDAEADGDRIWGVIRGSAVNQNGASAGLTVPNGSAQERVMEAALKQAGFSGADVDYLEAHATGSQLGDAIEAHAVGSVYGKGREAARPLLMGTVKSNIGHLEAAAGVAGIIKTVLAMKQGVIPKHLHFESPNPQIEWASMPVRITSEKTDWPENADRPPRAAVSAFGISGTNAHVVLEGYGSANANGASYSEMPSFASAGNQVPISMPERLSDLPVTGNGLEERSTRFIPLSGKSDGALRDLAAQYLSWLDEHDNGSSSEALTPQSLADAAWMASIGRSHFDHRAGVVFADAASMRDGLAKVRSANGESDGAEPMAATRVAFLYTGDGSQWAGMGKALYDCEPVARAVLDRCDAIVRAERGNSLLDAMFGRPEAAGNLGDAAWAQPALYALECALTALWASIGIRPNTVFGQGTGEIAAAQAAGVFSLEDGLRFVLARSTLMAVLPGVDPNQSLKGLEVAFEDVEVSPPSLPMISGVTGRVIDSGNSLDGAYWSRQARASAELGICALTLAELGVDTVIELGPKAVMGPQMREAWPVPSDSGESARTPLVIASMSEQHAAEAPVQSEGFIDAVARAYEAGMSISFEGLFAGESRRRISLPTYPFQRRRHWV